MKRVLIAIVNELWFYYNSWCFSVLVGDLIDTGEHVETIPPLSLDDYGDF